MIVGVAPTTHWATHQGESRAYVRVNDAREKKRKKASFERVQLALLL